MSTAIATGAPVATSEVQVENQSSPSGWKCCGYKDSDHASDFGPNFAGHTKERKCTDVMWSILFTVFWVGMLVVGVTAFNKAGTIGGVNRHVNGYQMDGKICGQIETNFGAGIDYKYRYQMVTGISASSIADPTQLGVGGICVKTCPTKMGEIVEARLENKKTGEMETITTRAIYPTSGNPTYTWYCTPTINTSAVSSATSMLSSNATNAAKDYFQEMLYDVNDAMGAIWASFGFSILFSFLFLLFVKLLGGVVIFVAITCGLTALFVTGYFFYFLSTCTILDQATFASCGTFGEYEVMTYQLGCGLTWGLFVVLLLVVIFMRARILLAIRLMKQAVNAINAMKTMLLTPILMMLPLIFVLLWWLSVCVAMAAAGDLNVTGNTTVQSVVIDGVKSTYTNVDVPLKTVVWDQQMYGLFFYHIFGLLWTSAFFLAAMNFILSSATSQWYFAETVNGELNLGTPVLTGIQRAFGVHGGTMAFGSFLVAVFETIRMIVDYLAHKARKESGNNIMVRFACCIAQCCVRCFECIVKFITAEAYVFTALFGTNLCTSVGKTFAFIGANLGRVGILTMVGNMIVFIGKIFVMGLTMMSTYAVLVYTQPFSTTVGNVWLPLIVAMMISYVVVNLFMAVFARTLDTLLICFVAEESMSKRMGGYKKKQPGMGNAITQEVENSNVESKPTNTPMHMDSDKSGRFI